MRRTALLLLLSLYSACHIGTSVNSFAPAMRPRGVEVEIHSRDDAFQAELLAVSDTGLLLARDSVLLFAPYQAIRQATFRQLDVVLEAGERPDSAGRETLRLVSRFPQGVPPERLQALLAAYHQDSLRVVGQ